MEARNGVCEIVEVREGLDGLSCLDDSATSKQNHVYSLEDDINRLFQAIEIRSSAREETLWKSRMKRPMRASTSQASGIGISETSNLKQALRGLCILQASELAAMKRRSLKPAGSPGMSEVGTLKRFYRAVVAEAGESGLPLNKGKASVVEISLPERFAPHPTEDIPECAEAPTVDPSDQSRQSFTQSVGSVPPKSKMLRAASQDKVVPLSMEAGKELLDEFEQIGKLKASGCLKGAALSRSIKHNMSQRYKEKVREDLSLKKNDGTRPVPCSSSSSVGDRLKKSPRGTPPLMKLALRNKSFIARKEKIEPTVVPSASSPSVGNVDDRSKAPVETSSAQSVKDTTSEVVTGVSKPESVCSIAEFDGRLRSKEKGEISQSSKSSNGDFSSSTTSMSGESSSLSGSSRCGNRPHMSKDLRWEAIGHLLAQYGRISLKHFKLLKRLGSGDIGTVYLAQLMGTNGLFALKVMDNEFLARRKKSSRAETEREILQMLDHPFLPTLYAHFSTDKLSCLVMEYCPGGDLHVLRQKQPARNFSEQAARFYAAEVLLALEYLHMLGIVYRDLKPENILVREDGHIMLSDFDLSLRCAVNLTVLRSTSPVLDPRKKTSVSPCTESGCIDPFCLQPSWQASCFTPRLLTAASKTRKLKPDDISLVTSFPQLIAEPTDARSNSFVGTHEYLAPEIIKGGGHGSAVDWWTLGIFLYELLYGRTPFRGTSNEETVASVVSKPLRFPDYPLVSFYARDLIRGLLVKEPENRSGFVKGAAEIKQHPFFDGLNWALIRCAAPPERPKCCNVGTEKQHKKGNHSSLECDSVGRVEFDLF